MQIDDEVYKKLIEKLSGKAEKRTMPEICEADGGSNDTPDAWGSSSDCYEYGLRDGATELARVCLNVLGVEYTVLKDEATRTKKR